MTVRPYTQQFINEPLAHIRYASEIDVDGVEVCGQPFQQPLGLAPGDENRPDFEKLNHGSCADEGSIHRIPADVRRKTSAAFEVKKIPWPL